MYNALNIEDFLKHSENGVVLDVRSPSEFEHGHIPGAISFPLFSDDEREIIGTIYKKSGKDSAILKGLGFIGPRLKAVAENALEYSENKPLFIHCWRGGMRSKSVVSFLQQIGIQCYLLNNGYKAYRNFVLENLSGKRNYFVIGGKTGSGKTEVLEKLQEMGQQVIHLEKLASHKGSAFGRIGQPPQPSNEQFGNNLLEIIIRFDADKPIWIEDESRTIGKVSIPNEFYNSYRKAPLMVLDMPFQTRLLHLMKVYGSFPIDEVISSFERIRRKLGGQNLNMALTHIEEGNYEEAAAIALKYYDKTYTYGLQNKDSNDISYHTFDSFDAGKIASYLIELVNERRYTTNTIQQ